LLAPSDFQNNGTKKTLIDCQATDYVYGMFSKK